MKRTVLIGMSAVGLLAFAFLALTLTGADGPSSQPTIVTDNSSQTDFAPGEAGLRARINPETGQVDVTSIPAGATTKLALDPATAEALRRDSEGLKEVFHPDGSVSVNLKGRFQSVSVIRIDENGKRVICTDNTEHVCDVMNGATGGATQTPEVQ